MVQHGDELSYEIGSALRLQPSHTTQRGGLLRLAAATPKISAEITQKKTNESARKYTRATTHHAGSQPRYRGEAPEERHRRSALLPHLRRRRNKQAIPSGHRS
jgi:hypothetical protein